MDLAAISDQDLVSRVVGLVGAHRELTAKLVAHLAEIEERRLHLLAGYSSMFDFCQQKLGMSEGEAFRRILAARVSRRFPLVLSLLSAGHVNLSTLELVRDYLTEENHEELLAAVAHKRKREVMECLAVRFPKPDKPTRIQRLASIDPLSEGRFRVEFTASQALCEKLERCRDLMSHANPDRELAAVIERAVELLLAELEKRRLGRRKRPARASNEAAERNERHPEAVRSSTTRSQITTALRREVFERDGARCTYVAESGRRCEARAFLELDHIDPRALGGSNDAANLRVCCRAHNQLWAERAFGRARVERARHLRQKKSTVEQGWGEDARNSTLEKVRRALRGMGFRDDEARRAVAAVAREHGTNESLAVERALREAILFATAA